MVPTLKGFMFPVGFPFVPTCGAPQAECTRVQPSKTPAVYALMEFNPNNLPILWKEAGVRYPPKGGGALLIYGKGYLVSLRASREHVCGFMVSQWSRFHRNFGIRVGLNFWSYRHTPTHSQLPLAYTHANTYTHTSIHGCIKQNLTWYTSPQ